MNTVLWCYDCDAVVSTTKTLERCQKQEHSLEGMDATDVKVWCEQCETYLEERPSLAFCRKQAHTLKVVGGKLALILHTAFYSKEELEALRQAHLTAVAEQ